MRFIIGFLSGVLGALAGWAGLAFLVIALAGSGHDDGGTAMGAFFNIGPVGGLIGFVAGVLLFVKFGTVTQVAPAPATSAQTETTVAAVTGSSSDAQPSGVVSATATAPVRKRVSPVFAVVVLAIVAGLAWWGWYELIRSPYLTHGYMTLHLQFKLPAGTPLPVESSDVKASVYEGGQYDEVMLGRVWHGTDSDGRRVILATATLDRKTRDRVVRFEMSGVPEQTWRIDLPTDPDPTPGYSPWRLASGFSPIKIEMNFSLTADR